MKTSLILGFFDGVHRGHRAVIETAQENPVLITFKNSPAQFFHKPYKYIYSREDSLKKIKNLGVQNILELDFSSYASMPAEDYINFLVQRFAPSTISTGFNHTFGKNKGGTPDLLFKLQEKYNYKYHCVPAVVDGEDTISSTLIKDLLKRGEIERANTLLESNFILEGIVEKGAQLGRTLGFPTANITYPADIVEIPYGVYYVKIGKLRGIMNWGEKPTIDKNLKPVVEVHIFDFSKDLYGQNIRIEVLKKIREEIKFANLEDLKQQINKDINTCLEL